MAYCRCGWVRVTPWRKLLHAVEVSFSSGVGGAKKGYRNRYIGMQHKIGGIPYLAAKDGVVKSWPAPLG